jgi:putative transposase
LSELPVRRFLEWIELSRRKFRRWRQRFGKVNEHNGLSPRDHQIEDCERQAIIAFFYEYPLEGYRRLAFMILDRNLVAVSPSTVYRVLKAAGLLHDRFSRPSRRELKVSLTAR